MKLSYLKTVIILTFLRLILFIHLCVCGYKAVTSSVFSVSLRLAIISLSLSINKFQNFYSKAQRSPSIARMLDPEFSYWEKYFSILEFACWAIFGTSFNSDIDSFIPGKLITAVWIIIGASTSIFILVQVLNLTMTIHCSRTKFYEVINQLEAYMLKKQFPLRLQKRLRFFYKKKFRKFYYREDEILGMLSGDWSQLFLIPKEFNCFVQTGFSIKIDWWIF